MIRPQAARRPQCAVKWDRNLKPKLAIMRQCTSVTDRRTDGQTDRQWHRSISARCILHLALKIASVCPSVCFHLIFRTEWRLTLTFCVYVGHDHGSQEIKGQCQRSRLGLGSQFESRSVGRRSSIEDSFLVWTLFRGLLLFGSCLCSGDRWSIYSHQC